MSDLDVVINASTSYTAKDEHDCRNRWEQLTGGMKTFKSDELKLDIKGPFYNRLFRHCYGSVTAVFKNDDDDLTIYNKGELNIKVDMVKSDSN